MMDKASMLKMAECAAKARQERMERGLKAYKTPFEKALENPASLRLAVNAKCYDCIGQDNDPDWRGSIANCICFDCPLYPVRPFQAKVASLPIVNQGEL